MKIAADKLLIGAHTSAAGGAYNALLEGESIGATTVQLFTANQKQWKGKELTQDAIDRFHKTKEETGLEEIMSHASYLINLGCPNADTLKKSRQAFREELMRCQALGISYLNFHPGAALKESVESCLDRIIESLLAIEDLIIDDSTVLLLEATAGQGSCVGHRFEELAYIIEQTKDLLPIGVCIDTCHIFAAGYDIRTVATCNKMLEDFDAIVGLDYLFAFHLNDSIKELGSRRDRHAPLGEGEIGMTPFKFLMEDRRTRSLPKYLETPGGPMLWEKEIWKLREYAK